MTRAEIESLSGRELDAAVAVQVFGIEGPMPSLLRCCEPYSTSWLGMMAVVARLTAMVGDDGDHLGVQLNVASAATTVTVYGTYDDLAECEVDGPPDVAAPLAVARAALMAVSKED